MKFAFVLTNLAGGGAEKAVLKTAAALSGRGHEVSLIVFEQGGSYPVPPGIRTHFLGRRAAHGWLGKRLLAWRLARLLRPLQADVVVSTLPFADEVCALAKIPNHWCRIANTLSAEIGRLAAGDPAKAERRARRYRKLYGKRPLIAVSAGVASDLRSAFAASSHVVTIPNPFDVEAIRSATAAACPGRPDRDYVLHVGRFSSQKRHDLLLDAWKMLDERLCLVLLAAPTPELQALIDARGLQGRVHVAGFQDNPYAWMAGAKLLVLCSDHEGLPNVLIEALICGTPVVSTDCPSGPREILADVLPDALVPCGNAGLLAERISRFLSTPPDLSKLDFGRYAATEVALAYEQIARLGKGAA